MARKFIDGFEGGNPGLWDSYNPGDPEEVYVVHSEDAIFDTWEPPTVGDYCLYAEGSSAEYLVQKSLTVLDFDDPTTMCFKLRIQALDTSVSRGNFIRFKNAALTTLATIAIEGGYVRYYTGGVSETAAATLALSNLTWYLLNIKFTLGTEDVADGNVQINIDGVDYYNSYESGVPIITNDNCSDNAIATVQLFAYSYSEFMFDDFVLDDEDLPGDGYIKGLFPVAQGADNWIGSDSPKVEQVQDVGTYGEVDGSYIYTSTAALRDSYTIDSAAEMESIYCVQVCARARRQGTPNITRISPYVTRGVTDYDGDPKTLSLTVFSTVFAIWETDPSTGSDWEPADVSSAKIGVLSVAPA